VVASVKVPAGDYQVTAAGYAQVDSGGSGSVNGGCGVSTTSPATNKYDASTSNFSLDTADVNTTLPISIIGDLVGPTTLSITCSLEGGSLPVDVLVRLVATRVTAIHDPNYKP
jgi:hypothetical protein